MPKLRPARAGEGQALYEITDAAMRGLAAGYYTPGQVESWMNGRDGAYYEVLIAAGFIIVAAEGEMPLGYVEVAPGEITRLFLRPDAAGQGLGRRLLERGIEMAGGAEVRLNATLNAAGFYEHCGFVPLERVLYTPPEGGAPVEIVKMLLHRR